MAQGRKTGGRQKGTPNRTSRELKEAILDAFDAVGGVEYLKRLAGTEPRVFATLLGRLLPTTLGGDDDEGSPVTAITRIFLEPASFPDPVAERQADGPAASPHADRQLRAVA